MSIKASVVMSVFNTKEEYLREAIDSILNQTFTDFEFIIIDDACDDKTKEVLYSYKDERIVLISNEINHGLTYNLNRGIEKSSGDYIVRMDADDIAREDRLEKQIGYMDSNPDVCILGSYMDCGGTVRKYWDSYSWELRKVYLLFDNIGLGHPSVVIRKSFLTNNELSYDETIKKSQDYELWTRCINYTNLYVYPECLMTYRIHENQISTALSSEQQACVKEIKTRQLQQFKHVLSDEEINHFSENDETSTLSLFEYRRIVKKIISENRRSGKYNKKMLKYVLRKKYRVYLNYHYLNLFRIEKYIIWPILRYSQEYSE